MAETMRTLRPPARRRSELLSWLAATLIAVPLSFVVVGSVFAARESLVATAQEITSPPPHLAAAATPSFLDFAAGAVYRTLCPLFGNCNIAKTSSKNHATSFQDVESPYSSPGARDDAPAARSRAASIEFPNRAMAAAAAALSGIASPSVSNTEALSPADQQHLAAATTGSPYAPQYVTKDELSAVIDQQLNQRLAPLAALVPALRQLITYFPTTQPTTNTVYVPTFSTSGPSAPITVPAWAASQRIDSLSGTQLTNVSVSGVSGLTDADIPDGITASNYLPIAGGTLSGDLTVTGDFTVSGAQTLSGAITIPYLTATSALHFSTITGGLITQASSTIGNGTQTGGLTISGGATTTGNAYFGGTLTGSLLDRGGQSFNVKAFGAKGDGVTDDTSAIQAAIDAAGAAGGGVVNFPAGTYNLSSTLNIGNGSDTNTSTINNIVLRGSGAGVMSSDPGTLVRWVGPAGGLMMDIRGSGAGFGFSDIRLDANSTAAGGLRISSVRNSTFSGFTIQNFTSYGLLLRNQTGPVGSVHYSSSNHFERFYITTGQHTGEFYGIHIQGDYPAGGDWFRNTFVNGVVQVPKSEDAISSAAYFEYLDSNTFIEVDLNVTSTYTGTGYALLLDGRNNNGYPQNNLFYGCSINAIGVLEGPGSIGQNIFYNFTTADGESVPSHPKLRGFTDTGRMFGSWTLPDNAGAALQLTNDGSQTPYISLLSQSGTTGYKIKANVSDSADYGLSISDSADNVLGTFTSTGRFGIGTTTPWGRLSITASGTGATNDFVFADSNNSPKFVIQDNGNVGIGTTGPINLLHLENTNPFLRMTDSDTGADFGIDANSTAGAVRFRTDFNNEVSGSYTAFEIDGTERMRINSSGNVGIGTTTPNWKLVTLNASGPQFALTDGSANEWTLRSAGGNLYFATSTYSATSTDTRLTIASSGSVGIASTSPWRTLGVTGTVGFDGLTPGAGAGSLCLSANNEVTYSAGAGCTGSSQRFKHDISPLDAGTSLDTILKLNPVSFVYNDDIGVAGRQVGLIAEQVQQVEPRLVATDASGTPFTVKYENLTAILAGAIQKLSAQLSDLADTVASFADHFTTRDLTFTRAEGDYLTVNKQFCLADVCVTRDQFAAMLAAAGQSPAASPSGAAPQSQPSSSTPPTIEIQGNNPAHINIGDSYNDLGARITGPTQADTNLGIKTFLNGALVSNIVLDTTAPATATIDYVASNAAGTSTSTRNVIIEAPQPAAPPEITEPSPPPTP